MHNTSQMNVNGIRAKEPTGGIPGAVNRPFSSASATSFFDYENEDEDEDDWANKKTRQFGRRGLENSSAINVSSIGTVCARPAGRISCALSCASHG